ncbi:hypothetical protein QJS04_geneDACA020424 [Acorus gramineus]|uniref:Uncharacterized protein n=1 Tax=Acorus gramineus TaxID=55184 RepID=A0AAV9BSH1_ACOGR|nr:hypothetical protein QJS04_geneDACA020424 [Acorus gramineus]
MEIVDSKVLRAIRVGFLHYMVFKASMGASGQILVCWNAQVWKMIDQVISSFLVTVLENKVMGWRRIMSGLYGPNDDTNKGGTL